MVYTLSNLSQTDRMRIRTVQQIRPVTDTAIRSLEMVAVSATGELVLVLVTHASRRIRRKATLDDVQASGLRLLGS